MSEIGEAIGSVVEGGLLARAIEPRAGEHAAAGDGTCLNCGNVLTGPHCHMCGQKAVVHRTISAFMQDLLHGALHLDGKMWHTLPLLVLKPGELTRRYINGQRAYFVSPMALFLFSVFLMFAVFQIAGISAPTDLGSSDGKPAQAIPEIRAQLESRLAEQRKELSAIPAGSLQFDLAEERLKDTEESLEDLKGAESYVLGDGTKLTMRKSGYAWLDRGLSRWNENPGLMIYKLQANSYKFSWLLIPISIPFVWLLFAWKRRFKAYDHAIFVTYSLGFMTLLFIALTLLGLTGLAEGWVFGGALLIPPIHIYKQLRGTYELSRFSALWRLCVLLVLILVILILFLQALILVGLF